MSFADVAKEVYVIAPNTNPYWAQWESYFAEPNYHTTEHNWCGLGIKDHDSGRRVGRHTRISATKILPHNLCKCGVLDGHVKQLRTT